MNPYRPFLLPSLANCHPCLLLLQSDLRFWLVLSVSLPQQRPMPPAAHWHRWEYILLFIQLQTLQIEFFMYSPNYKTYTHTTGSMATGQKEGKSTIHKNY